MKIQILLKNDVGIFDITKDVLQKVSLTTYYKEFPSYINLKFLKTDLDISEGDSIALKIDEQKMFFGYIFDIRLDEEGIYIIKAYDQIRYLITRDTYIYKNKSASQVFSMICNDFQIKKGEIQDTSYLIPYRIEENQQILDIIYTALDITKKSTGKSYIIFDDFGKLSLKNYESMETNILIDLQKDTLKYKIKKSIDKDVYNSVKVSVKNRKNKIISTYLQEDLKNKQKWGTLRYFERLPNTFTKVQAQNYAKNILNIKNKSKFEITLEIIGNCKIRAGNILTIINKNQKIKMIVKKCQHIIENNFYKTILELTNV